MKYTKEITISAPRQKVLEVYTDQEKMKMWMKGLQKVENIAGQPMEEGSKRKLFFDFGKRQIEMAETITANKLPESIEGEYVTAMATNLQVNDFEETGEGTRWVSHNEFRLSGFMKVIGFLMPSSFKKQTTEYMNSFKRLVEKEQGQEKQGEATVSQV